MSLGVAIAGSGPKERKENDNYQTGDTDVTRAFLNSEKGQYLLSSGMRVREPACGKGYMSNVLLEAGLDVVSTDLIDRGFGEVIDWLEETDSRGCKSLVTNPPFTIKGVGNGQSLFLEKAISLDFEFVAMFAKIQFWNASSRLKLWDLWKPAAVYPLTWRPDFTGQGSPTMDCMWVVWDRNHQGDCVFEPLVKPSPKLLKLEDML